MQGLLEHVMSSDQFDVTKVFATRRKERREYSEFRFKRAVRALDEYLERAAVGTGEEYLKLQHEAIIGDPTAKNYFVQRIKDFLLINPDYVEMGYPRYYSSLEEALFQETMGFGPMSIWFQNPTESAQVNGTAILFEQSGKKVLQDFSFETMEDVERLIRSITMKDETSVISPLDPTLDVDMLDGTRVSIMKGKFVEEPIITFRQYPFNTFTFEELAKRHSIPVNSVKWHRLLARLMLNSVVTGGVNSGKTSLLKVIYEARQPDLVVITLETDHFEIRLKQDFPDRAPFVIAAKLSLEEMQKVFPKLLRMDAVYIMVPEVRSAEVELMLLAAERGGAYLVTYHSPHIVDIPSELATLSLNLYPSRSFVAEHIRAAKTLDLVYWMDKERDSERRVMKGVYAFEYDYKTHMVTKVPWMQFDPASKSWSFNCDIPSTIYEKVKHRGLEEWTGFLEEFERLASVNPMKDPDVQQLRIIGE